MAEKSLITNPTAIVQRLYYEPARDPAAIRRFLAAPLAARARDAKERQLREALRREG
jgi:hypothetical protein